MNTAIVDNTLLLAAAIIAFLLTRFTKQRTAGAISSFFLLFAPLIVFLNMWAHTIAVLAVDIKRYNSGSFQYSFAVYALVLFGVVFIISSGISIDRARKIIAGDTSHRSTVLWINLVTALLFLPLFPINPIALLPVLASIVSSISLWLMKSTSKNSSKNVRAVAAAKETVVIAENE